MTETTKTMGDLDSGKPPDEPTDAEDAIVRAYLTALQQQRPRRGRPKDPKRLEKQLDELADAIASPRLDDPLRKLKMIQRRIELRAELDQLQQPTLPQLAEQFIAIARQFSTRAGISWAAWRELGVPPSVLERAGIPRDA